MAELFTEEDVQLVGRAIHRHNTGCTIEHRARVDDFDEELARVALDALAKAGRLFPPPGYTITGYIEGTLVDALFPDGEHRYFSTHCRHALLTEGEEADRLHAMCSASEMSGTDARRPGGWTATIERRPANCKHCPTAPCVCTCHQTDSSETPA